MVQQGTFPNGGGYVHKLIVTGYHGHFSAWHGPDGALLEAEQRVNSGATRGVKCGSRMWRAVETALRPYLPVSK